MRLFEIDNGWDNEILLLFAIMNEKFATRNSLLSWFCLMVNHVDSSWITSILERLSEYGWISKTGPVHVNSGEVNDFTYVWRVTDEGLAAFRRFIVFKNNYDNPAVMVATRIVSANAESPANRFIRIQIPENAPNEEKDRLVAVTELVKEWLEKPVEEQVNQKLTFMKRFRVLGIPMKSENLPIGDR
jgi:hypothetical protein